jgi:hypothetical protein
LSPLPSSPCPQDMAKLESSTNAAVQKSSLIKLRLIMFRTSGPFGHDCANLIVNS